VYNIGCTIKTKSTKTKMPTILPVYKSIKTLKSVYYSNSIFGYGFSSLNLKESTNLLLSLENMEQKFQCKRESSMLHQIKQKQNRRNKNLNSTS
jgi:hypothetical protein